MITITIRKTEGDAEAAVVLEQIADDFKHGALSYWCRTRGSNSG